MKFIWLTKNYRINIESIFSLEKQYIVNPLLKEWVDKYSQLLESYKKNLPPLPDDNGQFHQLTNESNEEDIKLYSELISEAIYDKIGEKPDEYVIKYVVILSTGIKINIPEDKYNEINKIIDKNDKKLD